MGGDCGVAWPDRYSEMAMSADTHMLIPEYRSEHATLKLSGQRTGLRYSIIPAPLKPSWRLS